MKFTKVLKDASCYGVGNAVEWGQFWVGCYCGVKLQFVHNLGMTMQQVR